MVKKFTASLKKTDFDELVVTFRTEMIPDDIELFYTLLNKKLEGKKLNKNQKKTFKKFEAQLSPVWFATTLLKMYRELLESIFSGTHVDEVMINEFLNAPVFNKSTEDLQAEFDRE